VFALLGKRWTGQIVDLLLQGPVRFSQLAGALPGLSHRVLTERLAELQQAGLVARGANACYTLTPRGEGLRPAIDALAEWCESPPAGTGGACLEDGQRAVWDAFSQAGDRVRDALEQRVRDRAGVPPSYVELLRQLRYAPGGRLRMSELAAATRSKPSRITHAVNRLEQAGWITRENHPTDGRGSTATITALGVEAMDAAGPEFVGTVRDHVLAPLTPQERHQLRVLCDKILASFPPELQH
jgi:DNA-binding HxlR family transcriptional regulator